jgi:hypothetical protein
MSHCTNRTEVTFMRWWALISGATGLIAELMLLAFSAAAQPWTGVPRETWMAAAHDYLVIVQFAALIPVALTIAAHAFWSFVGVAVCGAVTMLQILFVTGTLTFENQVGFVAAASIASMLWAGSVSRDLAPPVRRLGLTLLIGVPLALVAFIAGTAVTIVGGISWAWVAGGAVAVLVWLVFPLWALVLGFQPVAMPRLSSPRPAVG